MLKGRGRVCVALAAAILVAWPVAVLWPASGAAASSTPVSVFPVPGSRVVSPKAQIAFRGLPVSELGTIVVRGSRSGVHAGTILGDSDGRGGSFIPSTPFEPGEIVTVSTGLNILGASDGTFEFTVAIPAGGIPALHWPAASRVRGDVWRFRSRPDLAPAAVKITKLPRGTAPGDVFVAPQYGPVQDGPEILGPYGGLIWFQRLTGDDSASDFRVQSYLGKPVLTWWQGYVDAGIGVGEDVIYSSSYQQIAAVHAANGLSADLHEFEITPQNTALITAYYPVYWDASSVHGSTRQVVLDTVVQEIDIPTGLVLFQWDSLDHVPLSDSHEPLPKASTRNPYDYFHINSIDPDWDGNLVISARNTWAAYKVSAQTGATIWELGGKQSSFKLGSGASFAFQHDVRVQANNDLFVTMFDDGAGPPTVHSQSRGIKLILDLKHLTARLVAQHEHTPALLSNYEGNFQQLPNHDDLIGWGQQPDFSEYNPRGRLIFDGEFVAGTPSYRAYRFQWSATPQTPPALAATASRGSTYVYASWNGATNVSGWRVLAGPTPSGLRRIRSVSKTGFETAASFRGAGPYVAVQALDSKGRVLGTSQTVRAT